MKKMNEKAMKAANGGWGAICPTCPRYEIFKTKASASWWVFRHNLSNTGHRAYCVF